MPQLAPQPSLLTVANWADYTVLDTGHGRKLEQVGPYIIDRPEPSALWQPAMPELWETATARFSSTKEDEEAAGQWQLQADWPDTWPMDYAGVQFHGRRTTFRHIGFFPEQEAQWRFLQQAIKAAPKPCRVLNLFGYSGVMSLLAAAAGAEVTHVDASKKSVGWGRENAEYAGLSDKPIRWLVDDARRFVARELRRGSQYHGIILDPPKFGRGPEGEVWQVFEHLPQLLADCAALLAPDAQFMILTGYSARLSSRSLAELMQEKLAGRSGTIDYGDYTIEDQAKRQLGLALFARWRAEGVSA